MVFLSLVSGHTRSSFYSLDNALTFLLLVTLSHGSYFVLTDHDNLCKKVTINIVAMTAIITGIIGSTLPVRLLGFVSLT